jgi:RNase P subunit RPR2
MGLDIEQNTRLSRWDLHTVLPCVQCGTSEKFPLKGKEKEASDFTGCAF